MIKRTLFSRLISMIGAGFLLAACGAPIPLIDSRPDIELTWSKAIVALPPVRTGEKILISRMEDSATRDRLSSLPARTKVPVILYLHGCTGLGENPFFSALAQAGYVMIAPDSMARRYRPLQCDPKTRTGGHNRFVYDFRLTEISFALDHMKKLPWVDLDRMYLIGVSEGGVAAALYRGGEFRARIIAQWTCAGASFVRGLSAPSDEPVLAVVRSGDPWYDKSRTTAQRGDCGAFMHERPKSRSVVLKGAKHNLLGDEKVVNLMLAFLEDATR